MKFIGGGAGVRVLQLLLVSAFVTLQLQHEACQADVGTIITPALFNSFLSRRNAGSPCHTGFYTRDAFLSAARSFPAFGTSGSLATQKRELAAFFAHVAHETGSGCYTDEIGNNDKYHGRGPLQLTGQGNYQAAGNYLNVDLVGNPNLLSTDATISFKSAIWFWMQHQGVGSVAGRTCHAVMTSSQGFGYTTRIINPIECNNGAPAEQQDRVQKFQSFCSTLGIDPQGNLYC